MPATETAAPTTLAHLVNSPGDEPYCGWEHAWPPEKSSPPRKPSSVGYAGLIETVMFLDEVTCEPCLHEAIRRTNHTLHELDQRTVVEGPAELADRQDLDERLKEAVERLGELSLKRHHPAMYEILMREKNRPEEPRSLGAIVKDARGCYWLRESVSSGYPWREFGAVRLGIEGEDDRRWDDVDAVKIVFHGISS